MTYAGKAFVLVKIVPENQSGSRMVKENRPFPYSISMITMMSDMFAMVSDISHC